MSLQHLRNEGNLPKMPPNGKMDEGAIAIDLVNGDIWAGTGLAANNPPVKVGGIYGMSVKSTQSIQVSGDGTIGDPINANLIISADDGNLLTVRDDGVGVWVSSDPAVSTYYVSGNWGLDSNSGTSKDEPLATFGEACDRIREQAGGGVFTIYLRAGETFHTTRSAWNLSSKAIRIYAYDDPKYGTGSWGPCLGYQPSNAADFWRPTLRVTVEPLLDVDPPIYCGTSYIHALSLEMQGIVLEGGVNNTGIPYYGLSPLVTAPTVRFISCYIRINSDNQYVTYRSNLVTMRCHMTQTGVSYENKQFHAELDSWRDYYDYSPSAPACGDRSGYSSIMPSNIRSVTSYKNLGYPYDLDTKTIFGCTVNWNVFI